MIRLPRLFKKDTRTIEERLLAGGRKSLSKSKATSVIFFTTWKCGSVITDQIFKRLSRSLNIVPVDFQTYLEYNADQPFEKLKEEKFLNSCFPETGFLFGPFKLFINIPNLHRYKIIIQLRDPRDVLTSMYYSFAYSHPEIHDDARNKRKEFQASDVNTIALKYAPEFLAKSYSPYMQLLKNNDNILFVKYEEMVTNFESWLEKVSGYLDINLSKEAKDQILKIADFRVDGENVHSHKRSVQPGNHKKHLTEATIAQLNNIFADVNSFYGY